MLSKEKIKEHKDSDLTNQVLELPNKKKRKLFQLFGSKLSKSKKSNTEKEWQIEVDNYENLSKDVLEKILVEGEKYFDYVVDNHESLTKKSFTLLSLMITILGIVITFIVSKIGKNMAIDEIAIITLVFVLLLISSFCIYLLLKIIYPKEMMLKGDEPKPIDFNGLSNIAKDQQLFIFIYNSIGNVQAKIDFNSQLYSKRINAFETVLKISSVTFIVTLFIITIIFFIF